MSQTTRVLNYMKANGSITQAEADGLKVKRLASRINDLRKDDKLHIKTETMYGRNEYGSFRYARYSLEVEP